MTQPPPALQSDAPASSDPPSGDRKVLGTLLLISVLMVIVGRALFGVLPDDQLLGARIVFYFGLGLFGLGAWTFTRGGTLPDWMSGWLTKLARLIDLPDSKILILLAAPAFSLGAWFAAGEAVQMRAPWLAVVLWILGIAAVLASVVERRELRWAVSWPRWEYGLLLGLLVIATLVRIPNLENIPWLLTGDEGFAGLSALEFLHGSRNNIFNTAWDSWPAFYLLIPASSIALFGQTATALRLPSATAGILTVIALYPLARYMLGRTTAIVATSYLAVFHFHIHFSRIAMHTIWDGLIFLLVTYMLYRAWTEDSRVHFALAGLISGLALYFYASARGLALVIPIWLVAALLKDRTAFRQRLPGLTVFMLGAVTVALPLGLFYLKHPDQFFAPLRRFSILGDWMANEISSTGRSAPAILLSQFRDSALAFTETNLRYWYHIDSSMLLPVPAAFFLLGLVTALMRIRKLKYLWILLWIAVAILAGALSESTPAAQRYVFTAPAVAMLLALGLVTPLTWLTKIWPSWRRALLLTGGLAIIYMGVADLNFYFLYYTPSRRFGDGNTEVAQAVARYLVSDRPPNPVYFAGFPRMGFRSHGTLPYLAPGYEGIDISEPLDEWLSEQEAIDPPLTFVGLPEREETLRWARSAFPGGDLQQHTGPRGNPLFWSYEVPEG